jgi:hypothetical protein
MLLLTSERAVLFVAIVLCSTIPCSALAQKTTDIADSSPAKNPPQVILKNDTLKLTIFLPDSEKGYYRGTRFDWSGLIGQSEYKGHTFFGPWKTTHDPKNFEDADGTAEEFGIVSPPGYDVAKVGEPFLKIGIGLLEKPKEDKYQFFGTYKIVDAGAWKIRHEADWIEFEHNLGPVNDWGYRYVKRIQLTPAGDGFTIQHTLKNTGKNLIETDHYCHNFIRIDEQSVGVDYVMDFAFEPKSKNKLQEEGIIKDRQLQLVKDLKKDQALFTELAGMKGTVEENQVTVKLKKSGVGVRISGDAPLDHFNVFAVKLAMCPEPFVKIRVEPGKDLKWTSSYRFFAETSKK